MAQEFLTAFFLTHSSIKDLIKQQDNSLFLRKMAVIRGLKRWAFVRLMLSIDNIWAACASRFMVIDVEAAQVMLPAGKPASSAIGAARPGQPLGYTPRLFRTRVRTCSTSSLPIRIQARGNSWASMGVPATPIRRIQCFCPFRVIPHPPSWRSLTARSMLAIPLGPLAPPLARWCSTPR